MVQPDGKRPSAKNLTTPMYGGGFYFVVSTKLIILCAIMPQIDYDEDPVTDRVKRTFDSKDSSKFFDPCQEAATKSLKCLRRNMGDRDMCTDYFQAYRDCKKRWVSLVTLFCPLCCFRARCLCIFRII
jgi:cytochrome c oxidase assembly protein subunit 23